MPPRRYWEAALVDTDDLAQAVQGGKPLVTHLRRRDVRNSLPFSPHLGVVGIYWARYSCTGERGLNQVEQELLVACLPVRYPCMYMTNLAGRGVRTPSLHPVRHTLCSLHPVRHTVCVCGESHMVGALVQAEVLRDASTDRDVIPQGRRQTQRFICIDNETLFMDWARLTWMALLCVYTDYCVLS